MSTSVNEERRSSAVAYLLDRYAPSGSRIGWLMIASIFIESWDLYSVSFVNVFLKDIYHPSSWLLGLSAGGTQAGAVVGALVGGRLSDRFGRRPVFMTTMVVFIVFGVAQAFAPDMAVLAGIRFVLGIPLGSDIANGYSYIMESLPAGRREVMGNRWQLMFAAGEIAAGLTVAILYGAGVPQYLVWRIVLGLGAVPALVLLFLRREIPETAIWLVERGRYHDAKEAAQELYDDDLEMLPDENEELPDAGVGEFVHAMWSDVEQRRATLFGWIASAMQSLEFSTFAFYLPVMFVLVGVSSIEGTTLITTALYVVAVASAFVGPMLTPKLGQRGLSIWGFALVLGALIVAGIAIHVDLRYLVPVAAAVMLWGHYWDSENVMTVPSMVAQPRYRGVASGVGYTWVKLPGFLGIFLFPTLFAAIGTAGATFFTAVFPAVGLLAAIFLFREVYGHHEVGGDANDPLRRSEGRAGEADGSAGGARS